MSQNSENSVDLKTVQSPAESVREKALLERIISLELECSRLRQLNDKLLDDVVHLEIAYQDAIGARQFVFDGD